MPYKGPWSTSFYIPPEGQWSEVIKMVVMYQLVATLAIQHDCCFHYKIETDQPGMPAD